MKLVLSADSLASSVGCSRLSRSWLKSMYKMVMEQMSPQKLLEMLATFMSSLLVF